MGVAGDEAGAVAAGLAGCVAAGRGVSCVVVGRAGCVAAGGDGDVLAAVNGDPLLATGEYGRGRVVQLAYSTSFDQGGNRSLTPPVDDTGVSFHYWEYQLSLLAK